MGSGDEDVEEIVRYQFKIPKDLWEEWKLTVPRNKSLEKRLRELIKEDKEERRG